MLDDELVIRLLDHGEVRSADGRRLGRVGQLFRSDSDGASTWVSIDPGDEGDGRQMVVPMAGSTIDGDDLRVAYRADDVTGAPSVAVGAPVSSDEERNIRAFYGLDQPDGAASTGGEAGVVPDPPADEVSMLRSEERLGVDTRWVAVRRARLEKFQVTETRTIEVPWTREDVRVVYEPIEGTAANAAAPTSGTPQPWVLREERVIVTKEWVPVETARLVVERVAAEQDVTGAVRKERISVETIDTDGSVVTGPPAAETGD